jgi:hypothetical protein
VSEPVSRVEGAPAGVLIIRVWFEGGYDQPRLRVLGRKDVTADAEDSYGSSSVEDVLGYTRRWLEAFVRRHRVPSG